MKQVKHLERTINLRISGRMLEKLKIISSAKNIPVSRLIREAVSVTYGIDQSISQNQ